jgi:hypothetical protein
MVASDEAALAWSNWSCLACVAASAVPAASRISMTFVRPMMRPAGCAAHG